MAQWLRRPLRTRKFVGSILGRVMTNLLNVGDLANNTSSRKANTSLFVANTSLLVVNTSLLLNFGRLRAKIQGANTCVPHS